MSAPTEENKKPAGIESFLIVAYRSLRGRKSGVSYRERNLIDASPEKIKSMAENLSLTMVQDNSFTSLLTGVPNIPEQLRFVLFQGKNQKRLHIVENSTPLTAESLTT